MMTVGSLFSGIGGLDLGLERTGHFKTIWFSEIDDYASRVLAKHWPNVPNYGDIKEIDFERIPKPDVLVGGYPCQPFSFAGQRRGETDPRHLWPECLRALRAIRPRYALFENVRGHLSLGFATVLSDLAALGFNAEWQIIPAAAVGAPHKRERLFIVAYPEGELGEIPLLVSTEKLQIKFRGSAARVRKSDWTTDQPDLGRVANGVPPIVDRFRTLGNAVVPQVAELVGYMIAEHANNA